MTDNPYASPNSTSTAQPKIIKRANNLITDARLAVLVGLIPILGLIYVLRLVQWYVLRKDLEALAANDPTLYGDVFRNFRSALPRLWFAVLFWPALVLFIVVYSAVA